MAQQYKIEAVEKLKEMFRESKHFIFTEYKGLTVEEITNLRRKLREGNAELKVVKNRLAKIAYKDVGLGLQDEWFTGPLALVLCKDDDFVKPLKSLFEFAKDNEKIKIKIGYLENTVYDYNSLNELKNISSKEELIAKLVGLLNSPAARLVFGLKGIISKFVMTLKAIEDKKGK